MGISFLFSLPRSYVVCTPKNRLIETILMSTHTMYHCQYKKENHPKLVKICSYEISFYGTQERVRNSRGKRAISVRATEVLL